MKPLVFVSHAWADRDRVRAAIERVARETPQVLDAPIAEDPFAKDGTAGSIREEIQRRVASAGLVILLWTKDAAESDWVQYEAGMADALGKPIVVVADRSAPRLPAQLAGSQVLELES